MIDTDLIFDVGAFDGSDTEYYIYRGFRVVAIEANPAFAQNLQMRGADDVSSGRLSVINAAISGENEVADFWVDNENPARSSFPKYAYKDVTEYTVIRIETTTLRDVFKQHGTPLFLKIDVEGVDRIILKELVQLAPEIPRYVSTEVHHTNPESTETLLLLKQLGYTQYRIISQRDHNHIYSANVLDRLLVRFEDSIKHISKKKPWEMQRNPGIRFLQSMIKLNQKMLQGKSMISDWTFSDSSSGPLPFEVNLPWMTFEEALYEWLHMRHMRRYRSNLDGRKNAWFDIHACKPI